MPDIKREQLSRNVSRFTFPDVKAGWEAWVLLSSDRHHDNPRTDWTLEKKNLDLVKKRDALIIDGGDLFCAMQGKYDKRASMDDIRQEDVGANYLDLICKHAADFYAPYAEHFAVIARGNHEDTIIDKHGHDLTSALVSRLNADHGGQVFTGEYGGWVQFHFKFSKSSHGVLRLKYYHGAGGGGPVTRGVIQTNRQAVYLPDADIVFNGHTHDAWYVPIARERLTNQGRVTRDIVHYIRTPGYKDDYGDGGSGWHVRRWGPPKPLGAAWLRFYIEDTATRKIGVEVTLAVN